MPVNTEMPILKIYEAYITHTVFIIHIGLHNQTEFKIKLFNRNQKYHVARKYQKRSKCTSK